MKSKFILLLHFVASTTLFSLLSCTEKPAFPSLLVQADSAYMRGRYPEADSLLSLYGKQQVTNNRDVQLYHELVKLESICLRGDINESHFSLADSLSRFYSSDKSSDKHAKCLFFLGCIYHVSDDYPSALNCYLKASKLAEECNDTYLSCLLNREMGDIYFRQRMLNECIPYYKSYYNIAVANHDTLRMSLASSSMGRVYTILNDADSTIAYYKKAISLAETLPQKDELIPLAQYRLCDIYIQTEEYDSALAIMPRDTLNDENWAYWHYGQHHVDSAIYHFRQMLGKYSWQVEVETLKLLAELEMEKGNTDEAIGYFIALQQAEDSLKSSSQIEETRKINANYNYSSIKQERDKMEDYGKRAMLLSVVLFVILLLLLMAGIFIWKYFKQKRQSEMERLKRLDLEREKRYSKSLQKLEQNKRQIALLETQLAEERKAGNQRRIKELETDAVLLNAENRNIEAFWQKKRLLRENAKLQPIYQKVLHNVGKEAVILTDDDWQHIEHIISAAYPDFTLRLLDMVHLKDIELRVCYLLKMEVQPSDIGPMVGRVKSTISMMCSRIYLKLTQQQGSSKDLTRLLQTL